ncbi:6-bladed beta-propeller [Algoriphagus hitonicola]|uniref:6-bladed beta-propeller protein n=1 Tax=Algoriphagus hitonicola TaxID=435880 RepID=A0A1I2SV60_9BACT|nr:6-bladed beta-propeller [Algoriphagus hitonicola]SFG56580.1 hypothetical protein SAMN04487988_10581 [Algoriphagus hitonicola]
MKQYIFILFFILMVGCNPSGEKELNYTKIVQGLPSINDVVEFNNYFEISEIIPLETSDSSIIDYVYKVVADEYLFIKGGGAVYKFDRTGKFLSKIEKGIDGPNNFKNLTDIILLPEQNRIWIYDSNNRNILQFDYDFNFEIKHNLGFPLFGIERTKEQLLGSPGYMRSTDKPNSLLRFSGNNLATGYSFQESYLPFNEEKSKYLHINRSDYFSATNREGLNFVNSFNDSIYYIDKNGVPEVEYVIDFEDKKVLEEDLTNRGYSTIVDVFTFINSTDKSFNVGNIVQTNEYLIYRFFNSGKPFISIYNKTDNSLSSGQKIKLKLKDREFIFNVDEEMRIGSFGNGYGYISLPLEGGVLDQIEGFETIKEGDNPIIILFHEK